jgi:hypothetical protein
MLAGSDVIFATALKKEDNLLVNVRVHCTQNKPATVANILIGTQSIKPTAD